VLDVSALAGCSLQFVAETVSKAQVCSDASSILGDMEQLLVSSIANPLAIGTYFAETSELSEDFASLTPQPSFDSAVRYRPHKTPNNAFPKRVRPKREPPNCDEMYLLRGIAQSNKWWK